MGKVTGHRLTPLHYAGALLKPCQSRYGVLLEPWVRLAVSMSEWTPYQSARLDYAL
jgi:hypothetical protein